MTPSKPEGQVRREHWHAYEPQRSVRGIGTSTLVGVPLFFFDWLFRDVSRGSLLERTAAWRSNREMRRYLPVYLRRWLVIFVGGYGMGVIFEKGFELIYAAACCYSSSCISASVIFIIVFSWFALSRD